MSQICSENWIGLCFRGRGDDKRLKPQAKVPLPLLAPVLKLSLKGALELLGSLIKPDGLDDSWLDSWLTVPPSIYSHKYVDEPEAISFRKSTSLNIFRKLNFYGWPSLQAAKMPKSASNSTWMAELSAGGCEGACFCRWVPKQQPQQITGHQSFWMAWGAHENDRHSQGRGHFSAVAASSLLALMTVPRFTNADSRFTLLSRLLILEGRGDVETHDMSRCVCMHRHVKTATYVHA